MKSFLSLIFERSNIASSVKANIYKKESNIIELSEE